MRIADRVKNILLTPKLEWPIIAAEPATISGIYTSYAIPLALLPLVGALLRGLLFGHGFGLAIVLVPAVLVYAISLGLLYVMAMIADAVAPSFDGRKSQIQAFKLVVYAATPQWIAGFFGFIPGLNVILSLVGFAYGAYLLYLGSTATMGVPEAKSPGYTAVIIVIWILVSLVVMGAIVGAVVGALLGGFAMTGAYTG